MAVPAWPTQARAEPRARWHERGVVVAALIGLVSVTVAVLAWRSAQLDENATDADRAALTDAAIVRLAELEARVFASTVAAGDAKLQTLAAEARDLRAAAAAGGPNAARDLARAEELETEVEQLLFFANRVLDDDGLASAFDRDRHAEAILAGNRELGRHDPEASLELADEKRDQSVRLAALAVVLAVAVFLLTGAQVSRRPTPRIALMAVAVLLWIGSVVATFQVGLS